MQNAALSWWRRPPASIQYAAAFALAVAAYLVTVFLRSYFEKTPNALFFCAVILSGWLGGLGPGLLAGMLSVVAIEYGLANPAPIFANGASEVPHILVFSFAVFLVCWIGGKRKRAEEMLRQAHEELETKVVERTWDLQRINEELARSETYLSEGQKLSHTGSWTWHVATKENVFWSKEHYRIYGFDPKVDKAPYEAARRRIHPEDVAGFDLAFETAIKAKKDFEYDHRVVLPDQSVKYVHVLGHPSFNEEGVPVEYIGTVMDVTERKLAEEALRQTEADLARVARATTVGELTASIAHEVNQPLAAIVTNADACVRWLVANPPNLAEARAAAERIIRDGNRGSEVISRIRALLKKGQPGHARLSINDVIRESVALAKGTVSVHRAMVQTELEPGLPPVLGDRVQLQQVLLNLVVNALDAMESVVDRPRLVRIRSGNYEEDMVLVAVVDSGTGLKPQEAEHLFEAFYTTKPNGLGMGLSISRSIIERHGGRLWVEPGQGSGAIFQFTLPILEEGRG